MATSTHTRLAILIIGALTVHASSYSNPKYSNPKIARATTTKTCIYFTAPHSIYINNGRYKTEETYTDDIARAFSKTIGGGYATWNNEEKIEAKRLAKKYGKGRSNKRLEAMGNADPNYLLNSQRMKHGWMKYLREARRSCTERSAGNTRGMHLDMHGMSDATAARIGEHLVIGTRAMETTQNAPRKYAKSKSLAFRNALKTNLTDVLTDIQNFNGRNKLTIKAKRGSSKKLPVRIALGKEPMTCNNIASTAHRDACRNATTWRDGKKPTVVLSTDANNLREKFVGDWTEKADSLRRMRNTLTRISTEKALWNKYGSGSDKGKVKPFGCAVQIEMSMQLRKLLADTKGNNLGKRFAKALKAVYKEARCSHTKGSVQLS
jgi:hypothetical protein